MKYAKIEIMADSLEEAVRVVKSLQAIGLQPKYKNSGTWLVMLPGEGEEIAFCQERQLTFKYGRFYDLKEKWRLLGPYPGENIIIWINVDYSESKT